METSAWERRNEILSALKCCIAMDKGELPIMDCSVCVYGDLEIPCRDQLDKDMLDILERVKKVKIPGTRKLPCVCGKKRVQLWMSPTAGFKYEYSVSCPVCGLAGKRGKSNAEATENWNIMIATMTKEKESEKNDIRTDQEEA